MDIHEAATQYPTGTKFYITDYDRRHGLWFQFTDCGIGFSSAGMDMQEQYSLGSMCKTNCITLYQEPVKEGSLEWAKQVAANGTKVYLPLVHAAGRYCTRRKDGRWDAAEWGDPTRTVLDEDYYDDSKHGWKVFDPIEVAAGY